MNDPSERGRLVLLGASSFSKSRDADLAYHPTVNWVRQVTAIQGSGVTRDDCLPTMLTALETYLDFIGPEGWVHHVEHVERIAAPRKHWVPDVLRI